MIRSMTGFGAADGRVGAARVTVEVRTVNHRFFSPTLKLPGALARWEGEVREALRLRVARGHVTLFARHERDAAADRAVAFDGARVDAYLREAAALVARHRSLFDAGGIAPTVELGALLRHAESADMPAEDAGAPEGTAAELLAVVEQATAALAAMREAEGRRLAGILHQRIDAVEGALARIAERAPARLVAQRDRLRASVRELTDGVGVDEQRLAQEIAILADRLDVAEELDRFGLHLTAFRAALDDDGQEPVGKRLGFLLQEMLREANTTGSKAGDAAVLHEVVQIKEELERLREQVENVE